jgi:hypothetical protein
VAQVTTDPAAVDKLIAEMAEAYYRGPAQTVKERFRANSPIDTGRMQASHSVDPPRLVGRDWLIRFRVEADNAGFAYPVAVHNGRGVVRPVNKMALRWVTKAGAVVFATRSGPSTPQPWLWRTMVQIGFRNVTRPFSR